MSNRYKRIFSSRKDYEQTMYLLKFLVLPMVVMIGFLLYVSSAGFI